MFAYGVEDLLWNIKVSSLLGALEDLRSIRERVLMRDRYSSGNARILPIWSMGSKTPAFLILRYGKDLLLKP